MNAARLVDMANDISDFFQAEPERTQAVRGIVEHIERFWTPGMRRDVIEHLEQGGAGLGELAREAVAQLAAP